MPHFVPREVDKCIFCGGRPTNWEHVWSRWSHKYLPKGKRKWYALHATAFDDRTDYKIVKHAGDPHDWQVKCVDEACNNGWMRELENAARPFMVPMLTGDNSRLYLGKKQQTILAAWIALKTMIQEHAPFGDRISHPSQLRRMYTRRLAPETGWRIWIARFDVPGADKLWNSHPMLLLPDSVARRRKNDLATHYNSQTATYVIGKLLIHLIRSPHQNLTRLWHWHPAVAPKLCRIWPLTGWDVFWPPTPLTDEEAGYVAGAIHALVKRSRQRKVASGALHNSPP